MVRPISNWFDEGVGEIVSVFLRVIIVLIRTFEEPMKLGLLFLSNRYAQTMHKRFGRRGNLFRFS